MGVRARLITLRIWEAQGKCCSICGVKMVPAHMEHPTRGWTWDHVWPRGRYRFCARGNLLIAHVECNTDKGCRKPTAGEQALLAKVNQSLGFELVEHDGHGRVIGPVDLSKRVKGERPKLPQGKWTDGVTGPSALAVALERLLV